MRAQSRRTVAATALAVAAVVVSGCGKATPSTPPLVATTTPAVTWTADGTYPVEGYGEVLECEAIGDSKRERHLRVPSTYIPADGDVCPSTWEVFSDDHREPEAEDAKETTRPRRTTTAPAVGSPVHTPSSSTGGTRAARPTPTTKVSTTKAPTTR